MFQMFLFFFPFLFPLILNKEKEEIKRAMIRRQATAASFRFVPKLSAATARQHGHAMIRRFLLLPDDDDDFSCGSTSKQARRQSVCIACQISPSQPLHRFWLSFLFRERNANGFLPVVSADNPARRCVSFSLCGTVACQCG